MRIDHVAVWVQDIEKIKCFYQKYFNAHAGQKYHNPKKAFYSYFLSFESGARLEVMQQQAIAKMDPSRVYTGYAHLAMALGGKDKVDALTDTLRTDGYTVVDGPRTTGDGYYESVILDPEGNRIELTA